VFESVTGPSVSARLRSAAIPPIAAFLVVQGYTLLYPLLPRVPAALFWLIVLISAAGAVAGIVLVIRILRTDRVRGLAFGWLLAAIAAIYLCGQLFLAMTLPWL
jgi:hypothetical protein